MKRENLSAGQHSQIGIWRVGVQDQKIKIVFNTGGTWRQVTFEKLMMKIYDFF